MWVHQQHRRQNVMTTLLDTARSAFDFGHTVPRSAVAFTQTTVDGCKFATAYCGASSYFLVYEATIC